MVRAASAVAAALMLLACSSKPSNAKRTPAGTPTDPVKVCKHAGDVCELHGSVLGVCVVAPQATCGSKVCYNCQSQH